MNKEYILTVEELPNFINQLYKTMPIPCFIGLKGEMGSGKTTFTRHLIEVIDSSYRGPVTSPTFTIINTYPTTPETTHIDLFRLSTYDDLIFSGIEEHIFENNGIVLVEWYDHIDYPLPNPHILLHFEIIDEDHRKITVIDNHV